MEFTLEDEILAELREIDDLRQAVYEDVRKPITDEERESLNMSFGQKLRPDTDAKIWDLDVRMRRVHQLNFVWANRLAAAKVVEPQNLEAAFDDSKGGQAEGD